jgi:60 kDa SS-A/Ro ribonucleoprotein
MTDALEQIVTRRGRVSTPQREQADKSQVPNSAGGWTFKVTGETRIHRFLTLGVEGGTFYTGKRELVKDNASVVLDWAANHSSELVRHAVEVSEAGRAPRNQPALFALAAAQHFGDVEGRRAAAAALPLVARTGTHLFTWAKYLEQFQGWGPLARRAASSWYLGKDPEQLAYQLVKYRQREGWTHADVLKMAHPRPRHDDGTLMADHDRLFSWLTGRARDNDGELPKWVLAYERAREIERGDAKAKAAHYVRLIESYPGLPWEALPDEAMAQDAVLRALVDAGMPQTALMRQLPKLTQHGVLAPMGKHLRAVCDQLRDPERLLKGRVHPVSVLLALKTYAAGHSLKGSGTWTPVQQVIDALNDAFYAAFPAVEPAGKRTLIATDTSGSMGWSIAGYPFRAVEVVGALALVTAAREPEYGIYKFSSDLSPLAISPRMRLDDVESVMLRSWGGSTDCATPMVYATKNRLSVDTFQVYTDNETWFGGIHPHQALEQYRQASGINASLQVIAVTPTDFSIADPDDPRQLDVSGFDSDVPALLANHSRGSI